MCLDTLNGTVTLICICLTPPCGILKLKSVVRTPLKMAQDLNETVWLIISPDM